MSCDFVIVLSCISVDSSYQIHVYRDFYIVEIHEVKYLPEFLYMNESTSRTHRLISTI